jgi:hypothetical protein
MAQINFAALREHHLQGSRYERFRAAWFRGRGDSDKVLLCKDLAKRHEASADDALMGMRNSEEPKPR